MAILRNRLGRKVGIGMSHIIWKRIHSAITRVFHSSLVNQNKAHVANLSLATPTPGVAAEIIR